MASTKPVVGYVGTGSMGRPMIFKLLKTGYSVRVYDKFKETAATVCAAGAVWCDSPKECAEGGTDILITCLPLPVHVYENMIGETGALAGLKKGSVWIDMSTTDYHNTLNIAKQARAKGVYALEAPTSNLSHMGVDFCNASFYVGGDEQGFKDSKEVLDIVGKISFYVGEIGEAQTIKLLTNLLFYTGISLFGEMMIIARKLGVSLYWIWTQLKKGSSASVAIEQFGPFLFDGSWDHSCTLEIGEKDMSLTVALADELKVDLPLGRIIQKRYTEAIRKYDGQDFHVIVNKLAEEENGVDLRIPGFFAHSKYGIRPDYQRPEGVLEDKFGRTKPTDVETYECPDECGGQEWTELAELLQKYVHYTNHVIFGECLALGEAMGHSRKLLEEVIFWSVGTCYVSDNYKTTEYKVPTEVVDTLRQTGYAEKFSLPLMRQLLRQETVQKFKLDF